MPRLSLVVLFVIGVVLVARLGWTGSASPLYPLEQAPEPPRIGAYFNPSHVGVVQGQVTWDGPPPDVRHFRAYPQTDPAQPNAGLRPNPNTPQIDARSAGVSGAVIYLRGVNPTRSRPWDHPPVCIELDENRILIRQGTVADNVGFVRAGEPFTIASVQQRYQSLRARGAEFFTLAFPAADRPLSRAATRAGLTELSSAAHFFWQRAYLFTADHAYYTRTDAEGRFKLEQVPSGDYELVCWLPSWKETGRERDPELCQVARVFFEAPLERVAPVQVAVQQSAEVSFTINSGMFPNRK